MIGRKLFVYTNDDVRRQLYRVPPHNLTGAGKQHSSRDTSNLTPHGRSNKLQCALLLFQIKP